MAASGRLKTSANYIIFPGSTPLQEVAAKNGAEES